MGSKTIGSEPLARPAVETVPSRNNFDFPVIISVSIAPNGIGRLLKLNPYR
ncbi:hypothetical protein ES703_79960 [subsurface metagenome]